MRALLAAADSEATGEFNVGTSIETSILDLVEELAVIAGKADFIPEMQPARAGEIDRMALDPSRIIEHLGWRPETDLSTGLSRTWQSNARRRHAPERQIRIAPRPADEHAPPAAPADALRAADAGPEGTSPA